MPLWQFCWWPFLGWWVHVTNWVCDPFCGMARKRDPNSKVVGDLQRLGIKRSRIESPGWRFFFVSTLGVWRVSLFPFFLKGEQIRGRDHFLDWFALKKKKEMKGNMKRFPMMNVENEGQMAARGFRMTRWWQLKTIFGIFTPKIGEDEPNLTID